MSDPSSPPLTEPLKVPFPRNDNSAVCPIRSTECHLPISLLSAFSPTLAHDATRNASNVRIVFTAICPFTEYLSPSSMSNVQNSDTHLQCNAFAIVATRLPLLP